MRRFLQTYSFLLSGRWIGWFIVCCLGAALCLYLGNWQYDRAEQIDHSNQLIIDNYDADPLTGQEALSAFEDYDGSQPRLEGVERRHLLAAGGAPGRPEVQQHHLALVIGQRMGAPLGVGEGRRGHRGRVGPLQLGKPAVMRGLPVDLARPSGVCTDQQRRIKNQPTHSTPLRPNP